MAPGGTADLRLTWLFCPTLEEAKTTKLPFHPGIFRETKVGTDRSLETGSQYFLALICF